MIDNSGAPFPETRTALMIDQRVCVFGAGGVGGYIAAQLSRAGVAVSVVARGSHLQAIQRHGLTLETAGERFIVPILASDRPEDLGPQDAVIVTTKTVATEDFAMVASPLFKVDTVVAFASNGVFWFYGDAPVPNGAVVETVRLDRSGLLHGTFYGRQVLGVIVRSPNTVIAPGIVRNTGGGTYIIGGVRNTDLPAAQRLAEMFSGAGLTATPVGDVRGAMWRKLLGNVASSLLCCLYEDTPEALFGLPHVAEVARALMTETAEIARHHGFDEPTKLVDAEFVRLASLRVRPSMLQDMDAGRPMEFDSQILVLRDLAEALGLDTPVLKTLSALVLAHVERRAAFAPTAGSVSSNDPG